MRFKLKNDMENLTKVCGKCEVEKRVIEFSKNKNKHDGLGYYCKACIKKVASDWNAKNPEYQKKRSCNYRKNNKEKIKEYELKNTENKKKYRVDYYKKNTEKIKDSNRIYYQNNTEKCKEISDRFHKNNPEKKKKYTSKYREANAKKIKESSDKYIEKMTDRYIINKLKTQNLPEQLINNLEIIKVKRLTIQIYRLCKKMSEN